MQAARVSFQQELGPLRRIKLQCPADGRLVELEYSGETGGFYTRRGLNFYGSQETGIQALTILREQSTTLTRVSKDMDILLPVNKWFYIMQLVARHTPSGRTESDILDYLAEQNETLRCVVTNLSDCPGLDVTIIDDDKFFKYNHRKYVDYVITRVDRLGARFPDAVRAARSLQVIYEFVTMEVFADLLTHYGLQAIDVFPLPAPPPVPASKPRTAAAKGRKVTSSFGPMDMFVRRAKK